MRLIDADVLKKEFPNDRDWEYPVNTNEYVCEKIDEQPTIEERKKGRWTERHHAYFNEEQIEEWQSCKCSECGRYDTRPYLYYFSEPRFCSWCGAEMEAGGEMDD